MRCRFILNLSFMSEPEDARLPVSLIIGATIRTAAQQGIPIVIVRHGDNAGGALVLKVNRLDGTAHVYGQIRSENKLVWSPLSRQDPLPEVAADQLFQQQARYDPDVWLIEIEDRTGRHWFPGDMVPVKGVETISSL